MWKSSSFLNSDNSQYFYTIGALTPLDKYSQELRKTCSYSKYGTMEVSKMVTLLISKKKKKKMFKYYKNLFFLNTVKKQEGKI